MAKQNLADLIQMDAPKVTGRQGLLSTEAPSDYLADCRVGFADARTAVKAALASGFDTSGTILTSSPALYRWNSEGLPNIADCSDGKTLRPFADDVIEIVRALYQAFRDVDGSHTTGILAARRGVNFLSRQAQKARLLSEADLTEPRAVILVDTGDDATNALFNAPWDRLLNSNPNLKVLTVPAAWRPEAEIGTTFLERLKISPYARAYRLLQKLGSLAPFAFRRGRVLIGTENELVRDTAVHLAMRGFELKALPVPTWHQIEISEAEANQIRRVSTDVLEPFLERWLPSQLVSDLHDIFIEQLLSDIAQQRALLPEWQAILDRESKKGPAIVLTNYPKFVNGPALLQSCRDNGVKMIAFQHGVSREICKHHEIGAAWYESACADLVVCFNEMSAQKTKEQIFCSGEAVAAGMASEFNRFGTFRKRDPKAPPVFYVSTNLFAGTRQMPLGTRTDIERADLEIELIDKVLDRLPHRVLFKSYPEPRYFDPNPVLEEADSRLNIELFDRKLNLRYLLPDARVLVTSGATSTASFCLLSSKPLVFIDDPRHATLTDSARKAFEAGVFVFDASEANFYDRLRTFLSQPLDEIEARWHTKAEGRVALIRDYFTATPRQAGRVAANRILEWRRSKRSGASGI
jgi:hypothetical protein